MHVYLVCPQLGCSSVDPTMEHLACYFAVIILSSFDLNARSAVDLAWINDEPLTHTVARPCQLLANHRWDILINRV